MSVTTRPTPDEMKRVADWLAECETCGVEHEQRTEKRYDQREGNYDALTRRAPDGHPYRPRGKGEHDRLPGVVAYLRKQAGVHV